jgi:hypothetical protein
MPRPLGLNGRGLRLSAPRPLGSPAVTPPPPSPSAVHLVTEAGDWLVTESGAPIAAESA